MPEILSTEIELWKVFIICFITGGMVAAWNDFRDRRRRRRG